MNAANAFGGPALLLETVRQNFGIPVERYVSLEYGAFIEFIDRIGGVEAGLQAEAERDAGPDLLLADR